VSAAFHAPSARVLYWAHLVSKHAGQWPEKTRRA